MAMIGADRKWLDNGAVVWSAAIGLPLVLDVALMRSGHDSLCSHCRRHPVVTAAAIGTFVWHLL